MVDFVYLRGEPACYFAGIIVVAGFHDEVFFPIVSAGTRKMKRDVLQEVSAEKTDLDSTMPGDYPNVTPGAKKAGKVPVEANPPANMEHKRPLETKAANHRRFGVWDARKCVPARN
jgi:hypothetical protein